MDQEWREFRDELEEVSCGYFSFHELFPRISHRRKRTPDDVEVARRILEPLETLTQIRIECGTPMWIVAVYRLEGGAPRSAHKACLAIDADLQYKSRAYITRFLDVCESVFHAVDGCRMGHYLRAPYRVHVDHAPRLARAWFHNREGQNMRRYVHEGWRPRKYHRGPVTERFGGIVR